MPYNASDTRQIRRAEREAKTAEGERRVVVLNLMSSPSGRAYVFDRLKRSFVFSTPFTGDDSRTNFNCGVQNTGLIELAELMQFCPDQFIAMMREASDKEFSDGRRTDSGQQRRDANGDGRDSGSESGGPVSDYDPGDDVGDIAAD